MNDNSFVYMDLLPNLQELNNEQSIYLIFKK